MNILAWMYKDKTMRDFKAFLEHEKHVLLNNIDRQIKALEWYQDGDSLAQGHQKMIEVQKRHLAMVNTLLEGDIKPEMVLAICEEALKMAEDEHRQLVQRGKTNGDMWWETLDVIQFLSDLIYRIEDWIQRYQAEV